MGNGFGTVNVLITGGSGFLGRYIARLLAVDGHCVSSFSRGHVPVPGVNDIEYHYGDISDTKALQQAATGCDAVIHCAAKAGVWGAESEYFRINVEGTLNVISVCRKLKIRRLVHTSSPSVVFTGRDEKGIDESTPYAKKFLAHYPRTKALAEQAVVAANGPELATVALRPHLIWGPGDPHLVPRILQRAQSGRLALPGDGANRVDSTYVENAAIAHVLALKKLAPHSHCSGKVYFISNGEPLRMDELLNNILSAAGMPAVNRHIPAQLAYSTGALLELAYHCLRVQAEPPMTRFIARQLSTHHWFSLERARADLDYHADISLTEGFKRLSAVLLAKR